MAITIAPPEKVTRTMQLKHFKATIVDNDEIQLQYPCTIRSPRVYVNTGHGAQHAVHQLVDDYQKHVFNSLGKIRCKVCGRYTKQASEALEAEDTFNDFIGWLAAGLANKVREGSR